jgi:hypothetical protein
VNFFDEQTVNQFVVGSKRSNPRTAQTCMTEVNQCDGSQVCQNLRLEYDSNLDGLFLSIVLSCSKHKTSANCFVRLGLNDVRRTEIKKKGQKNDMNRHRRSFKVHMYCREQKILVVNVISKFD